MQACRSLGGWLVCLAALGCGANESALDGTRHAAQQADARDLADPSGAELEPVELALNWFPEAEHGGFYAALVCGYYREAGLDVRIRSGGPDAPVVPLVARGTSMFGVSNADGLLFGRAQQAPVVAVMAPLQISPRCILVHKESGIARLEDLKNLTLAVTSGAAFSEYLRKRMPLDGVKIVPYSGNVAMFLLDKRYAQQGYVFSEPFVAREAGADPVVLMVSDAGFNPYTSVLFTSDQVIQAHPEVVQKMVSASVRGWQTYLDDPQSTNARIHEVNPEMSMAILAYGAETMRPLVLDAEAKTHCIGTMSRERWQTLNDQLVETGLLTAGAVDVDQAFTTRFLPPAAAAGP